MNILVLLSGSSQAFTDAGYEYPKNLTEIAGRPMIQHVIENLQPLKKIGGRFICAVRRDENRKHHTGKVVKLLDRDAIVIELNQATSGAACSALLAVDYINNEEPLVITNGDQIIANLDLDYVVNSFQRKKLDAGAIVFEDIHPRWSFVKCDTNDLVVEAAEKRPISKLATAGFFYFAKGCDFVNAAMEMLKKNAQVNDLFYICPALNEMVLKQARIGIHLMERSNYFSFSTPSDIQSYSTKH